MNTSEIKKKAIKAYLKAINDQTKNCEIIFTDDATNEDIDSVHFKIELKPDPFYDNGQINVSTKFEFVNQVLFCKYFGLLPTYNNNHNSFWVYKPEYFSKNILEEAGVV